MSRFDDCDAVLARLYEFLDGECPEADADAIRAHLDACEHCVEDADAAVALQALVKRCCCGPTAPPALRERILTTYSVTYTRVSTVEF